MISVRPISEVHTTTNDYFVRDFYTMIYNKLAVELRFSLGKKTMEKVVEKTSVACNLRKKYTTTLNLNNINKLQLK